MAVSALNSKKNSGQRSLQAVYTVAAHYLSQLYRDGVNTTGSAMHQN